MILNDAEITSRCSLGMIKPFFPVQVKTKQALLGRGLIPVISYGLGSYGYDARVGSRFKIFTNAMSSIVDPKEFNPHSFVDVSAEDDGYVVIPPNSFALSESVEVINVPRDILVLCIGKSTYARCGIIVNVTPLEPEWKGTITLEISNTTPLPAKVYANEGIVQLIFLQSEVDCKVSYADRQGKYQNQSSITLPKV